MGKPRAQEHACMAGSPDLAGLSASTPIVVFAHIPLWMVYEKWGWGTADGALALALLKRFGSVTVLNGHIHQVVQKVEGNVAFHTAMATAFPQPAPGAAASPGPMVVPAGTLRSVLGVTNVKVVRGHSALWQWSTAINWRRGRWKRIGAVVVLCVGYAGAWIGVCASVRQSAWGARQGARVTPLLRAATLPADARGACWLNKCADCHSNETRWPFYSRVAPGSGG